MPKYNLIYADPPWQFSNKKTGGSMLSGAASQYLTTGIEDLKRLDVPSVAADDCALVMWWVGSMPQEAIDLVAAWGFTLKNMNGLVWRKLTKQRKRFFGMGFYTRAGSESCIIAIKGRPPVISHGVRAVHTKIAGKHSVKPPLFRDLCIELFGDVPRLEMFARTAADGWDAFGNEAPGSIKINYKDL
jgi:N6-adenosine-specific RNA methylase IME4